MKDIYKRLMKLRQLMHNHRIDFYLIPNTDAHFNEYVPICWQRLAWISNFTGSAAEILITQNEAYFQTDGRYYLQATEQLDLDLYQLMHQHKEFNSLEEWIIANGKNKTLGLNSHTVSIKRSTHLQNIQNKNGGSLKIIDNNLIDECRISLGERFELPRSTAFILDEKYTGESVYSKLNWLRIELNKFNADYIILSQLDEIAWLFNLRANDIPYTPLLISYALIGINDALLFVHDDKIPPKVAKYLEDSGVQIKNYDATSNYLSKISGNICLDDKNVSYWIYTTINNAKNQLIYTSSPITLRKACKNKIEMDNAKYAHIKDSVALINFFVWLEDNWRNKVDEVCCVDKLAEFRNKQDNLIGSSFKTISAFAANSAVIHYGVTDKTNKTIDDTNIYLLDSGGQYLEGTTDVTRTIHLGIPTAEQKKYYTLVLKAHLALAKTVFAHGACGEHLDAIARSCLWQEYLNYRHGTGHGVGSCLSVHEGPQSISPKISNVPLTTGMIVSNEPGFYQPEHYGIRIENLCLVVEVTEARAKNSEYGPFYKFENLTLLPYSKKLIDTNLLSVTDKEYLSHYYGQIRQQILPLLDDKSSNWLLQEININLD